MWCGCCGVYYVCVLVTTTHPLLNQALLDELADIARVTSRVTMNEGVTRALRTRHSSNHTHTHNSTPPQLHTTQDTHALHTPSPTLHTTTHESVAKAPTALHTAPTAANLVSCKSKTGACVRVYV
jgi:hypothetical protein